MKRIFLYLLPAMLAFAACGHKAEPVKILRFEKFLFEPENYHGSASDFNSPLLNYMPDDPNYTDALREYLDDPYVRHIYHLVDSLYGDLSWLEQDLGDAMAKTRELCPEMDIKRFYTIVTADLENYPNRVFCFEQDMLIDLDLYLAKHVPELQQMGLPQYITRLCGREYILFDCMNEVAEGLVYQNAGLPSTYLDHAIAEGKKLYFIDQVLPSTHDTIKLGYTASQLEWMEENAENVWGWLIQNDMLFSNDMAALNNLVDLAPKTNAFGDGSAPRTHAWIGWQIVKAYMKKSGVTIGELFAEADSRKILSESGWRP